MWLYPAMPDLATQIYRLDVDLYNYMYMYITTAYIPN